MLPQNQDHTVFTLYVGDMEKTIQDQQLYNVFVQYGPLYSVRIMKNSETKVSRGFGFVSFYNQNDAQRAKDHLNHYRILQVPIRVAWKKNIKDFSLENNIFIRSLPLTLDPKDFEQICRRFGPVASVKISHDQEGRSRGYGYLQFETKEAKDLCLKNGMTIHGHKVIVEEFKYKHERPEALDNNLYIKNFPYMAA